MIEYYVDEAVEGRRVEYYNEAMVEKMREGIILMEKWNDDGWKMRRGMVEDVEQKEMVEAFSRDEFLNGNDEDGFVLVEKSKWRWD